MKKLVVILLAICLVFAAALGVSEIKSQPENDSGVGSTPSATAAPDGAEDGEDGIKVPLLDYEKLYAAHRPDEVVMTVDGEQIEWDEYFSWYRIAASQIESYFTNMAMYGLQVGWEDSASEEYSFKEYLPMCAEASIVQLVAIEENAAEMGFVKDEAFEKELAEQIREDKLTLCGEEVSDEDFYAALAENDMSRSCYERISSANAVYAAAFYSIYGEQLEKINDEDVIHMLEDNGFLFANHILIMTTDPETGETLDGTDKAQKLAQAYMLYTELKEISNMDERVKRFAELKELYCEDTGKAVFPDGYVFTPGTMVSEFEDACMALGYYEVSEPIETSYGYHVIMRLPLDPDVPVGTNDDGTTYNSRVMYADDDYGKAITAKLETIEIKYINGFVPPVVDSYIK